MVIQEKKSIFLRIQNYFKKEKKVQYVQAVGKKTNRIKLYEFIYAHAFGDTKKIAQCYTELYEQYKKIYKINLPRLAKAYGNISTIEYAERTDKKEQTTHVLNLTVLAVRLYENQATKLILEFQTPQGDYKCEI